MEKKREQNRTLNIPQKMKQATLKTHKTKRYIEKKLKRGLTKNRKVIKRILRLIIEKQFNNFERINRLKINLYNEELLLKNNKVVHKLNSDRIISTKRMKISK